MDLYGELEWRGLVYDATEGTREALASGETITAYIGFDPTASSLHVGSLLPILTLARVRQFGHDAIALVGGGTGLIGDPSGKTAERQLLDASRVAENVRGLEAQLRKVLNAAARRKKAKRRRGALRFENNARWLVRLGAVAFMRDVGKHFTINWMTAKESIKRRLESDEGISYTEFSYLLLQAYDFAELHRRRECTLQIGGSDQWGNILAGKELIRRAHSARVHGLVFPLITTSSGTKFGKTEAGTIWLDAQLTSPYEFYQFWLNVNDAEAIQYLKFFTFLDRAEIAQTEEISSREPERRHAQRELAREVTALVHGEGAVAEAEANTAVTFSATVSPEDLRNFTEKVQIARSVFEQGIPVVKVLMLTKMTSSNSEGARLIKSGAISLNADKIKDERFVLTMQIPAVAEGIFRLSRGKSQRAVIEIVDEP